MIQSEGDPRKRARFPASNDNVILKSHESRRIPQAAIATRYRPFLIESPEWSPHLFSDRMLRPFGASWASFPIAVNHHPIPSESFSFGILPVEIGPFFHQQQIPLRAFDRLNQIELVVL